MTLADELSMRGIQYGVYRDGRIAMFAGGRILPLSTMEDLEKLEPAYHKLANEPPPKEETEEQTKRRSAIAKAGRQKALKTRGFVGNMWPRELTWRPPEKR